MNLMVYLSFDYHLMGMGIPIFRQVAVTIVVAENDTLIRLQIERSNPVILAPQLHWLSTKSRTRLTSPRRLIPACATKNTNKNKKERNQIVVATSVNNDTCATVADDEENLEQVMAL